MSAPEPAGSAGPAGGAGGRRPNLLVIMCDQLRATALRLYGDRQTRQPHLEALAASGVLYRRAFTPYPVCVPARVAFWTGRWPHLTGSFNNTNYLQPGETHLLQLLRGAGYATALVGKNHCFTEPDLARYFDTYYPVGHGGPAADGGDAEVAAAREWVRSGGGALGAAYGARISPFPVQKHGTWLIGEQADAFIRAPRDRPWCAWVSIADPHTPYQVSQPYASHYPPQTLRLPPHEPPGYPGKPRRFRLLAEGMGAGEVTDEHLRFLLSIYYGMIAVIDDVVGRLLRALQETGQREDTIVLFTADHGDYATEHRVVRKGAALYDATVRVPLIVSQPGRLPAGAVCEDLVSTLDALPSLTRLLDLPALPGRSGRPLPVVAGGAPQTMVFSETGLDGAPDGAPSGATGGAPSGAPARARAPWQGTARGRMKMARTRDWKYVHDPAGEHELYDLGADPYELTNLVERPEQGERVQDFRHALLDWCIESEDRLPVAQRTPDRGL
jgi:arylsulfatase